MYLLYFKLKDAKIKRYTIRIEIKKGVKLIKLIIFYFF